MQYDVVVIGGGLAGLTAGSLLAKRGLKVALIEKSYNPGGSCGVFKRKDRIFDQGAAMLYGFGEHGFNAHRFVMNCLEEPIDVIKHDLLYVVNFKGKRIRFYPDVEKFAEELSTIFPNEKETIHKFYHDMLTMYQHIMVETPTYTSADETNPKMALKSMMKHPLSYLRFLGYLNKSAHDLLKGYFKDPEIFKFFDKLTSTYCYATVKEAPAVLASVMFVDNHVGGSYYPAGSTLFLPGKLEKVIEEHGGDMFLSTEVVSILFDGKRATGVLLSDGTELYAKDIIYSGTVWNLYDKLIDHKYSNPRKRKWAASLVPTYPSVVLYTAVDKNVIPEGTAAIEMLVGNPDYLDESEVTAYILSVDDKTLCAPDEHLVIAIGPTFEVWADEGANYQKQKEKEKERLIEVLERRFPGFRVGLRYAEVATPKTIEHYTMKNGGAVAGPKQMLGQHLFKRLHIRTEWDNVYCCGESTVMGTGTPTVTTSGLSAANALLKKLGKELYSFEPNRPNVVRILHHPVRKEDLFQGASEDMKAIMHEANRCRFCEHPSCASIKEADIRGIMRRVAVGNFIGAKKAYLKHVVNQETLKRYQNRCIHSKEGHLGIDIPSIISYILHEVKQ